MSKALIGHTGFVGSNLNSQTSFDFCCNTKNIEDIRGKEFEILYCAGIPGTKWYANQNPEQDLASIENLKDSLDSVKFKKLVLISTIAVYGNLNATNEDHCIELENLEPYGRHRRQLEIHALKNFDSLVVRLPALFGNGLKKNAIYDMINKNYEFLPNLNSCFQYYCLDNLWKDIQIVLESKVPVVNISPTPIPFDNLLNLFNVEKTKLLEGPVIKEDMKTKYAHLWGKDGDYMRSIKETMIDLKHFFERQNTITGKIKW